MSDMVVARAPSLRMLLSRFRQHLRDTFWLAPALAMVGVFLIWLAAEELDSLIVEELKQGGELDMLVELQRFTDDAKGVVSTVSSAMMTFIGVVFSISLVAVQMASGQLTPRVVRLFVRSRITKATFAVFLATFVLTLLVLSSYDSAPDPSALVSVPLVQSVLTLLMVALSLLLFVLYVNATLRLMRVGHVVARIADEARRAMAHLPETTDRAAADAVPRSGVLVHEGRAGVLQSVDTARLVALARKQGTVLRVIPRIGDFLVPGTPLLAVPDGSTVSPGSMRHLVSVGAERTVNSMDLGFGLRQLSDIALRALSPAVNDPTTAVQALDRTVQLLAVFSRMPLGAAVHRDRSSEVRLLQPLPTWTTLVDLGFAEVRVCCAGNPQVSRRVLAGLDDLLRVTPPDRHPPLRRHRELLSENVGNAARTDADREFALSPDRQGIG
ncbi:DUF2254 domain-containing protein [Streptomyces sp. NPDC012421]|uniref:DUF2254 domain-containing protein n=1 Tax=Streptomyces sp. NPDC012421 TaxID=3364832 RepID=UPI0036E1E680